MMKGMMKRMMERMMKRQPSIRARLLALASLFIFAAACQNGDRASDGPGAGSNSNASSSNRNEASANRNEPSGSAAVEASEEDFEGTAGITEKRKPGQPPGVLKEVRTASHPTFDRVVFEFEGKTIPGYRLEYIDKPVRHCGSGNTVEVAGDGRLSVAFTPAQAHTDAGEATVRDRERRLNLRVLKEVESICDFEGEVAWVLGVASPNRYRVIELASPARLVVDIRH